MSGTEYANRSNFFLMLHHASNAMMPHVFRLPFLIVLAFLFLNTKIIYFYQKDQDPPGSKNAYDSSPPMFFTNEI